MSACECLNTFEGAAWKCCHLCGHTSDTKSLSTCTHCHTVYYCSTICHKNDMTHRILCSSSIVNRFMQLQSQLTNQPFEFSQQTCSDEFTNEASIKYLRSEGLYKHGMWSRESPVCIYCSDTASYGELNVEPDPYVLPAEGLALEDLNIAAPSEVLTSWLEYYQWRGFSLSSPIAMLMHHPLTVYHIVQAAALANHKTLTIVLAGVDKEADLVITYLELCALLPHILITIVMVGPLISKQVSHSIFTRHNLTVKRYSMTLQDFLTNSDVACPVDLVICLNAGLSAYSSWREAMTVIVQDGLLCYVTDYCLLSLELSKQALASLNSSYTITLSQPSINPFRDPKRKFCDSAKLPWYSHAFICQLLY